MRPGDVRLRDRRHPLGVAESIILPVHGPHDPALTQPGRGAASNDVPTPVARSRALVPTIPPAPAASPLAARRPSAGFLAQLIATAQQAPQTRARRRAAPDHASAAYGAALSGSHAGSTFHRSM